MLTRLGNDCPETLAALVPLQRMWAEGAAIVARYGPPAGPPHGAHPIAEPDVPAVSQVQAQL